ncbi:uncharacterized protein ARMOST_12905 [Armillaria ostoyae]|uniref:Uncharacterized protein n=1 Tax=Armillaria ostoyae TaxID=47428 RepID=A0A284RL91_ARMOS|nr:uncharacterized protein ARMOST_12905 [Armillaria ostoyae]
MVTSPRHRKEGERETVARNLLEEAGLGFLEFATHLD